MGILRVLYAFKDGLEFNQIAFLLVGEETLLKMAKEKKGYLSIKSLAEIKGQLKNRIQKKHLLIKPIYRVKSPQLLSQRLRLLGPGEGFHFIEKEGKRYKVTRNARDILSIKRTLSSLKDSFQSENMISTGDITVYTDPTFVEKYQESQDLQANVDRILKDIEKSWKELRIHVFDNYKEERKKTIEFYMKRINDNKLLKEELKDKAELPLVLKKFNEEIKQEEEYMNIEPQTIVVINPFDTPSKEDFFKLIMETDLRDKISQVKIYNRCEIGK
ncbi:MAG: hypothetical protein NTX92_08980 [Euryarchaeota archaeon]|nr:hypothetical protein [Euryarchaeota archaeon]